MHGRWMHILMIYQLSITKHYSCHKWVHLDLCSLLLSEQCLESKLNACSTPAFCLFKVSPATCWTLWRDSSPWEWLASPSPKEWYISMDFFMNDSSSIKSNQIKSSHLISSHLISYHIITSMIFDMTSMSDSFPNPAWLERAWASGDSPINSHPKGPKKNSKTFGPPTIRHQNAHRLAPEKRLPHIMFNMAYS